jgi:GT2 family glycosyltransferase
MQKESVDAPTAVVVLNWNGADDTLECLESLRGSTVLLYIIVVDNRSSDDSVERITASDLPDEIIVADQNRGYAGGNNLGLKRALDAGFAVIGVVNNDTAFDPSAVEKLVRYLPPHEPRAVTSDIRYWETRDRSWFAGGIIDRGWPRHLQEHELPRRDGQPLRRTELISGCCIFARAETWEKVGLFDDAFFLIFEDFEWSVRAKRNGVQLCVVSESIMLHKVSRSFSSAPVSKQGNFYFIRNGLVFVFRNERRHTLRFVLDFLIRPTLRALRRREGVVPMLFGWFGAIAFVCRQRGRAPRVVALLADIKWGRESRYATL